jgi:sulfopyruvate decarboxylase TPP-binding subunit
VNAQATTNAQLIIDQLLKAEVKIVAGLPDDWIVTLLGLIDQSDDITYVPMAREMEAPAICAGAFFGGAGSAAIMGMSGLFTCMHEFAVLNLVTGIPMLILSTFRGALDDTHASHEHNALYALPLLDALNIPHVVVDDVHDLGTIYKAYQKSRLLKRPVVVFLARSVIRPE